MVHKAFKFRIYPAKAQELLIAKTLGCCCYVYNRYIHQRSEHYRLTGKGLSYKACSADLTRHKQDVPWLKEPDSTALQSSLKHLDTAFKHFFSGTAQCPRFKSKRHLVQSYRGWSPTKLPGTKKNWCCWGKLSPAVSFALPVA